MVSCHVIYCDHYPDGAGEAGSNARERKPATVSHEFSKMCTIVRCSSQNMKLSEFSFPKVLNFLKTYTIGGINFRRLSNDVISSSSLPIEDRLLHSSFQHCFYLSFILNRNVLIFYPGSKRSPLYSFESF